MPLTTLFAILIGVIAASALTIWLAFAVLPGSALVWLIPAAMALAVIAHRLTRRTP